MPRAKFLPTLATGTLLGAFVALLYVWPIPFSLGGTLGTLAGGAAFGSVLALAIHFMPQMPRGLLCCLAIVAGGIAGGVWWLVVRPESSLTAAVLFTAGLALILVVVEVWNGQAAA